MQLDPSGNTDSYAALQAAINLAGPNNEMLLPAGKFKTSQMLVAPWNSFRLRGAGAQITSIVAMAPGYNTLRVGPGKITAISPGGYVRDIHLVGNGKPKIPSGISCLQLSGTIAYNVECVSVDTNDIGLDLINNNFATRYCNIRGGFGGSLNVGLYLRSGNQSGGDLLFEGLWINGDIAAASIAGQGGGYHFRGGQLTAGQNTTTPNDLAAAVIMGKDYLTGVLGESQADFSGTSFEGTNFAWVFRAFNQTNLVCNAIVLNPTSPSAPAIGVFKGTTMHSSRILLLGASIGGNWSNPALASIDGGAWTEIATYTQAAHPSIAQVNQFIDSIAAQSGLAPVTGKPFTWVPK